MSKRSTGTKSVPPKGQRQGQPQKTKSAATPVPTVSTFETPRMPTKSSGEVVATQEAKRAARMQKQAVARAAAERRNKIKRLRNIGITSVLGLLIMGALVAYTVNESNKPGQGVPQQPSPHLAAVDSPHTPYNSDPPTSGPHFKDVPSWGVHTEAIVKELQVHALEDAGVVINYRPGLDQTTVDRLAELTRSYDKEVLMSPYEGLSNAIVVTAWTRIDRMDTFDEARIKRFINAYKGIDHHKDSGS